MATNEASLIQDEFLTCPLCMNDFDDKIYQPKILHCHHTFCFHCLSQLLKNSSLGCPTCRGVMQISGGDVNIIPTDFRISRLMELFGTSKQEASNDPPENCCKRHTNEGLFFYCKTCSVPVCRQCTVLDHNKNEGHNLVDFETTKTEILSTIKENMTKLHKVSLITKDQMQKLETEISALNAVKEASIQEADSAFHVWVKVLEQRKKELKDHIKKEQGEKTSKLSLVRHELNKQVANAAGIQEKLESLTKELHAGKSLSSNMDELINKVELLSKKAGGSMRLGQNSFHIDATQGLTKYKTAVNSLGVFKSGGYLPSHFSYESKKSVACLKTTVTMTVYDSNHQRLSQLPISIDIWLVDIVGNGEENLLVKEQTKMNVKADKSDISGTYTFTFRPQVSGLHRCQARLSDQLLTNADYLFIVEPNLPVKTFKDGLHYPLAVCKAETGTIVVIDREKKTEQLAKFLDEMGIIKRSFKLDATREELVLHVAYNPKKKELVCMKVCESDSGADIPKGKTINIYDVNGKMIKEITNPSMKSAIFFSLGQDGKIAVTDESKRVIVFDSSGEFEKIISFKSNIMAFTRGKKAFVAIKTNGVEILDQEGAYVQEIFSFKERKTSIRKIMAPAAAAADSYGQVLVADIVSDDQVTVHIYNMEGKFEGCIDNISQYYPIGRLSITDDGLVLVPNTKKKCIDIYKYM